MYFSSLVVALLAVAPSVLAMPTWKRDNSSSVFAFTNVDVTAEPFVSGVTANISNATSATLTNSGGSVTAPISGTISIAGGSSYTVTSFSITAPAVFLLSGEFYPAAVRLNTKEGAVFAFLTILTADVPDTPFINIALENVGKIPATGDSTTLPTLSFSYFIENYIENDIFYSTTLGGATYYVRQLPINMQLGLWRGLKKAVTVTA